MLKKTTIIILTLFLFAFINISAKTLQEATSLDIKSVKYNLLNASGEYDDMSIRGGVYLGPGISLAPATARQVYETETTQRERQHYTVMGRQIVYAGWYNANCDYVFMNYSWRGIQGSTPLYFIRYALFDWGTTHAWDYSCQPPTNVSPNNSNTCNIDVSPDLSWAAVSYHHAADATSPWYSHVGYTNDCLGCQFPADTLPGPPNIGPPGGGAPVNTGHCGDDSPIDEPYVWPNLDVDTNSAGYVVTHVASAKASCADVPDGKIETNSLVYWRKVADSLDQPWTGTWHGPYFMDSAYIICPIVRADKNSDTVYYAYLKPLYYQEGSTHPCEANGLGHYQITHEVVYRVSPDDGASWGPINYITDYASGFEDGKTDPAVYDLSGLVDPNGAFHLVWGSGNRDPENECIMYYASKMWHWDTDNNCISIVYDASHPALFVGDVGAWNIVVNKYNISWCDERLYVVFNRFGGHPVGDTSFDAGTGDGTNRYQNGDIFIVCSDATGSMGKTWSDATDLTDSPTPDCDPGQCMNEHWPSMAMFSTDSLMIEYIEDKDPGAYGTNDEGSTVTDNPVFFMTWPCFTMADVGTNICYTTTPDPTTWEEIALAPNGQTTGCTTPASLQDTVILANCGNVDITYSTSSDAAWLTVYSGGSGSISAGAGPRNADDPSWSGAPGCAAPATIVWQANSTTLAAGNYQGNITVNMTPGGSLNIEVNLVVACSYFLPEYARITSGCWTVDVWNVPWAGHQGNNEGENWDGDMKFYACGGDSTMHPLYNEALIVGWDGGSKCFSQMMGEEFDAGMRALDSIIVTAVGNPTGGSGYWISHGEWCTNDSSVHGTIEYIAPGHQDTAVLIEKVRLWSDSGTLSNLIVGEGIDWDVRSDSNYDEGGISVQHRMAYQRGCREMDSVVAGMSPYYTSGGVVAAAVVDNHDYIYDYSGYKPDSIYAVLDTLTGYYVFQDSCTDLNSIFKFWKGTLAENDTLEFIKIKSISTDGVIILQEMIEKAIFFISKYPAIYQPELVAEKDTVIVTTTPQAKADITVSLWVHEAGGAEVYWSSTISSIDPPGTWLSVAPEFGLGQWGKTPDTTLDLTFKPAGLALGEYHADVTLSTPPNRASTNVHAILKIAESTCEGICGDANGDTTVNVSDAVYIINYVFVGGGAPIPLACGDANSDGTVNVSDAVYIINYVFVGGGAPEDCSPGSINWEDGDCCPFEP
jgi:hypothetical protein